MFAAESSDNCAGLEVISNKIVHETIGDVDVMHSIFTKTGEFSINNLFFEGWESKGEVWARIVKAFGQDSGCCFLLFVRELCGGCPPLNNLP